MILSSDSDAWDSTLVFRRIRWIFWAQVLIHQLQTNTVVPDLVSDITSIPTEQQECGMIYQLRNVSSFNSLKCSLTSLFLARRSAVHFFQILLRTVDFSFVFYHCFYFGRYMPIRGFGPLSFTISIKYNKINITTDWLSVVELWCEIKLCSSWTWSFC